MKITNFRRVDKGKVLASFHLELSSGLQIREMRAMMGPNGPFPSFPSRRFETNGETKYFNLVAIPDMDRRKQFESGVMKALEPYLEPSEEQEAPPPAQENIQF